MADIMATTLTPSKVELVSGWIGRQRWYAGKGRHPQLTKLRGFRLDDPAGEVGLEVLLLRDDATSPPVIYQVPLTYRGAPLAQGQEALVGTMEHGVLGRRWVYDAPHDPVFVAQLWQLLTGRAQAQSGTVSNTVEPAFRAGARIGPPRHVTASQVLRGEQSNTSVICELATDDGAASAPAIVKIFRTLAAGPNPDVVLQPALADAGCRHVPATWGWVEGSWDPQQDRPGHLAFAQEFLAGTVDAWRVALDAVRTGADFSGPAATLGAATATVHALLAQQFPTRRATEQDRLRMRASWRTRHLAAVAEVPALAQRQATIEAVLDAGAAGPWPALQRIHGDYHLGQVLDVPGRGWVLLDFEGEPLRPLAERNEPDLAPRDVAGMLRSFDYVAGTHGRTHPDSDPAQATIWAATCRAAFLTGYRESGTDLGDYPELLAALELDKALYEVVYEARNRPAWLEIPRRAIERLTGTTKG